ncbi:MAG: hypothetical protein HC826_00565 [Rhodospirillales bacterium]|nr:hypothetical protein [Rhodospirillales bacterium]
MQDRFARLVIAFGLAIVAGLLAVATFGLVGAAIFLALLPVISPAQAALATAAVALLLAVILLLMSRTIVSRPRSSSTPAAGATPGFRGRPAGALGGGFGGTKAGLAASIGEAFGSDAESLVRAHAGSAVVTALIAGFAIGVSPRLRRSLWRLLR